MPNKSDDRSSDQANFVLATHMFVDMMANDLHDPLNQGPNFDARTFPIAELTVAFLKGDEIIALSPSDMEQAKSLAKKIWANAWGFAPP